MNGTIKGVLALATTIFMVGCNDVTAPALADETTALRSSSGSLVFNTTTSNEGGQSFAASGAKHAIDFQGSIELGNPCHDVTGSHTVSGSRVTLTVTATSTGEICTQVITWYNYDGRVSGLSSGTYDFEIVHVYPNGTTESAFTTQVTVN